MKKRLLLTAGLGLGLSATQVVCAQVNFIRMGVNTAILAKRATKKTPAEAAPMSSYQGQSFPMQRTPAEELAGQKGEQIRALETELDRCHSVLVSSANGLLCTPEQQAALQAAMRSVAKAKSANMAAYQQEATFYLAENTRRQQAATPAPATN